MVVWPHKLVSQVLSPTPGGCSNSQTIKKECAPPVRRPQQILCLQKWMKYKAWEGRLQRCSCRNESNCSPSKNLFNGKRKFHVTLITNSSHVEILTQSKRARTQEKLFTCERIWTEQQEVRDFLTFRAEVQGEQEASSKLSEAEFHARFLEKQKEPDALRGKI